VVYALGRGCLPRILLVEDDVPTREMLSRRLAKRGYEVAEVGDGSEAIAAAHAAPPDIILMDLRLPVMDGWTAASYIKADPRSRAIPILALTAQAVPAEQEQAIAAGCDDVDTKPVDLARLLGKIEALLGARKPA